MSSGRPSREGSALSGPRRCLRSHSRMRVSPDAAKACGLSSITNWGDLLRISPIWAGRGRDGPPGRPQFEGESILGYRKRQGATLYSSCLRGRSGRPGGPSLPFEASITVTCAGKAGTLSDHTLTPNHNPTDRRAVRSLKEKAQWGIESGKELLLTPPA